MSNAHLVAQPSPREPNCTICQGSGTVVSRKLGRVLGQLFDRVASASLEGKSPVTVAASRAACTLTVLQGLSAGLFGSTSPRPLISQCRTVSIVGRNAKKAGKSCKGGGEGGESQNRWGGWREKQQFNEAQYRKRRRRAGGLRNSSAESARFQRHFVQGSGAGGARRAFVRVNLWGFLFWDTVLDLAPKPQPGIQQIAPEICTPSLAQ